MHEELDAAFGLRGRVAVVTGGASGIGRQAAITFAQAGATVVVADVDATGLAETVSLVADLGGRADALVVDVTRQIEVDGLAEYAFVTHDRIDVWANVAGIIRYSPIVDTTEADLRAVIDVNQIGVFWGVAAAGRVMRSAGCGSIINIASAGGDMPGPTIGVYAMTKAAVMHLTRVAAVEYGEFGVRVNSIAPGFIDTPMVAPYFTDVDGVVDADAKARIVATRAAQSPLRITGATTDIAYCMLYLASDAARFVTGQVLRPNGGVVMK